jgi:hypothetical protein
MRKLLTEPTEVTVVSESTPDIDGVNDPISNDTGGDSDDD